MNTDEKNLFEFDDEENQSEFEEKDEKDIKSPFDPKEIKIAVEPKTIDSLVARITNDEIDLFTEFQRKGNLWTPDTQSRLIESLLLRFPLPAFYFDATDDDKWKVVDGLQRLWSLKNFIVDKSEKRLLLTGLEILKDEEFHNSDFDSLNRKMQRRILETQVTTYLIQPGTPKHVKYNVFRRINTGGLILTSQEIRHALNQGKPANFLKRISENIKFNSIIRVPDKRMQDCELILRYLAYVIKDYSEYEKPMATFLDRAMEELNNKSDKVLEQYELGLYSAIMLSQNLFGDDMFSRSIVSSKHRRKLNMALFEVWTSILAKLTESEKQKITLNKEKLLADYRALFSEPAFNASISSSTSGKGNVTERFTQISNLVKKYKV